MHLNFGIKTEANTGYHNKGGELKDAKVVIYQGRAGRERGCGAGARRRENCLKARLV